MMKGFSKGLVLISAATITIGMSSLCTTAQIDKSIEKQDLKAYTISASNIFDNVFSEDGMKILPIIYNNYEESKQAISKDYVISQLKLKTGLTDADISIIENGKSNSDKVGTGTKIVTSDGTTYTVLIYGDVDGDGYVDAFDVAAITRHRVLKGDYTLTDVYKLAAMLDDDETIDVFDAAKIVKFYKDKGDDLVTNKPVSDKEKEDQLKEAISRIVVTPTSAKISDNIYKTVKIATVEAENGEEAISTEKLNCTISKVGDDNQLTVIDDENIAKITKQSNSDGTITVSFFAKQEGTYNITTSIEGIQKSSATVTLVEDKTVNNIEIGTAETKYIVGIPTVTTIEFSHKYSDDDIRPIDVKYEDIKIESDTLEYQLLAENNTSLDSTDFIVKNISITPKISGEQTLSITVAKDTKTYSKTINVNENELKINNGNDSITIKGNEYTIIPISWTAEDVPSIKYRDIANLWEGGDISFIDNIKYEYDKNNKNDSSQEDVVSSIKIKAYDDNGEITGDLTTVPIGDRTVSCIGIGLGMDPEKFDSILVIYKGEVVAVLDTTIEN